MTAFNRRSERQARRWQWRVRSARLASAVLLCGAVQAHAGDDHDAAPGGASHATPAEPRFAAESEAFELVGTLEGTRLVLWLDRWSDNAPVRDARIELDVGGAKVSARPRTDEAGYEAQLPAPLPEGVHPVSAVIQVGTESDLLAGELDVHGAAKPQRAAGAGASGAAVRLPGLAQAAARPWWVAGAALLVTTAILAFAFLRRRARRGPGAER